MSTDDSNIYNAAAAYNAVSASLVGRLASKTDLNNSFMIINAKSS
jgi:hypothetical protein